MTYFRILFYLLMMNFVFSQDTKSLQGRIIDSKSKEPLIGANVIIKGTAQGSATNVDGEFYISDIVQSIVNIFFELIVFLEQPIRKRSSMNKKLLMRQISNKFQINLV